MRLAFLGLPATMLRFVPDLVRRPAFVGAVLVLPLVVLYAYSGSYVRSRRLVTWGFVPEGQGQLLPPAGRLREAMGVLVGLLFGLW